MAANYDLNYFDTRQRPKAPPKKQQEPPPLKVAPKQKKAFRQAMSIVAVAGALVLLIACVISTNAKMTELQRQIVSTKNQISEEDALNAFLEAQLSEMVNLRNVDEKARELGLVQMDPSRRSYIRVEDGNNIIVRQGTVASLLESVQVTFGGLFSNGEEA